MFEKRMLPITYLISVQLERVLCWVRLGRRHEDAFCTSAHDARAQSAWAQVHNLFLLRCAPLLSGDSRKMNSRFGQQQEELFDCFSPWKSYQCGFELVKKCCFLVVLRSCVFFFPNCCLMILFLALS